jgi:hypothetical protein
MGLNVSAPVEIVELELLDPAVRDYVLAAISSNIQRAYQSDLQHFIAWGGTVPATEKIIAKYLADLAASLSMATLSRRLPVEPHLNVGHFSIQPSRREVTECAGLSLIYYEHSSIHI